MVGESGRLVVRPTLCVLTPATFALGDHPVRANDARCLWDMTEPTDRHLLSTREAAELLGVTQDAVRMAIVIPNNGTAAGIEGPGRPSPAARPLAHAYTLGVVAEFQGFLRALHDLAVERWMVTAVDEDRLRPQVEAAAVQDRSLDRGKATVRGITDDFGRIGLRGLSGKLKNGNPKWDPDPGRGDMAEYNDLTALRGPPLLSVSRAAK